MTSLYKLIKSTGQDIHLCRDCQNCSRNILDDMDVSFSSMIQMILINDVELLTSKSIWSDRVLSISKTACKNGINFQIIILALREEAKKCGMS